jgi:site-specific DNA-methyltransferase (adenine-specific)
MNIDDLRERLGDKAARVEQIGGQVLIQGDCRDIIGAVSFDTLCCDPPYGMDFRSNHRITRHKKITNDETTDLLSWACEIEAPHSKYIWMRWNNLRDISMPRSLITWVKSNHSMGDLEHEHGRKTEVCAFYAGPDHEWPCLRPTDVVMCARTGNEHHPTEKPVQLMMQVIRWTSGVVMDCFMGSGTTLVACQNLDRNGIGIELDPEYFEIACKRVDEATRQPRLFSEPPAKPVQEGFDL